jgi:hypothetical protein
LPPAAQLTSTLKGIGIEYNNNPNSTMKDGLKVLDLNSKAGAILQTLEAVEKQRNQPHINKK